jgi:methanethiol S-methyltransferase
MALSWAVFYFLHSVLAASKLKRILMEKLGNHYKWYRLSYTILSILLFTGIFFQALFLPQIQLWPSSPMLNWVGYIVATLGVIIISRSLKEIRVIEFLGLSQIEKKENLKLETGGIYSKMRHPMYLGIFLIFLGYFMVSGSLAALVHLVCLVVYLPFGIHFEEKNLIVLFGESYQTYQSQVPAFFPIRINKRA